jgi:hypothetical protein
MSENLDPPVSEKFKSEHYAMHHILPNSEIEKDLKKILQDNSISKEEKKELIQECLNKPHIKGPLLESKQIKQDNRNNHGRIQHAAVSHNRNNRVFGPSGTRRKYDPNKDQNRDQKDTEIAQHQSKEWKDAEEIYSNAERPIDRFRAFMNLPPTRQLKWKREAVGQKQKRTGPYIAESPDEP